VTPDQRAKALAAQLAGEGHLTPEWRPAFENTQRHLFLPDRIWLQDGTGPYRAVDRDTDPDRWWTAAYSDEPVITQVEDGADTDTSSNPSSSASMPRIVARMLDQLQAEPGMRVLEIGTGAGYNAALLSYRLGGQNVVTVEVDQQVAHDARHALGRAGTHPLLVTGDGAQGWADGGPFDRIIATCAVHDIPPAWFAQTRPGGIIVTPYGTTMVNGALLKITVQDADHATGRVVDDTAFMWMRSQRPFRNVMAHVGHGTPDTSTSKTDPRLLGDSDALLTIGLTVPGCRYSVGWGHGDQADEFTLWLADGNESWASVDYEPGTDEYTVEQAGPRRLWNEIEGALHWWEDAGRPERTRLGIRFDHGQQTPFLDDPARPLPVAPEALAEGRDE
jgi:protein-L-isoaspartate(D-aspartate) O-methyltransferase